MINNCTFMGRLVAEPDYKKTESGIAVCRFRIAIDRSYQKQGEDKKTDFIPCVCFRGTADFVSKYFRKGSMIALTGELNSNTYEKDGEKRTAYFICCDSVSFTGEAKKAEEQEIILEDDDELPFN